MSTTSVLLSTMLLVLALAVDQGMAASALCSATRPPGGSKSNSASQQAKECEVPSICECQFATTTVASASTSTAASATESAAPASSSDASASTAAAASTSGYNASAEPCPCVLMQELVNMKYLYLSISQQVVFEACLADIRIFLVDVSLDVKQKVGKIGHRLKKCFHENHDIKKLLKHKKIATWGRCYELIAAGVSFDSEQSDSLITFDASGECNLTRALVNATAGDVCGSGSSAQIAVIVGNAKKVLKKMVPGYDKGRKLGWLKKAFVKNLFVLYPQYEVCIRNVSIPGFGSFDQFLNLCDQYETSSSMSNSVLNGSATDCAVVKSLNDSLNSNATVNSTDSATLAEGLNYVQTLSTYFASTTDVVLRLKFVSAQFSALSSACRLLLDGIEIVGTYLSIDFSDVVVTSHFCDNNGCGNITYGSASMTYPETCMIDTAQNISDVEDAVNTFYASLTVIQKIGFNSYKNSIQNCIRSSAYGNNYTARYLCCVPYVTSYSKNNPTLRAAFLATQFVTVLVETVTTVVYGSFGGFCGCS